MRQVKARVWDTKEQVYVTWEEIQRVKALSRLVEDYNSGSSRFVLQWYTGKQDKHGKDIYEGDNIKYNKLTGRVVFDPYDMAWKVLWSNGSAGGLATYDYLGGFDGLWLEIVGNMYEGCQNYGGNNEKSIK